MTRSLAAVCITALALAGAKPFMVHLYKEHLDHSLTEAIQQDDPAAVKDLLAKGVSPNLRLGGPARKPTPTVYYKNSLQGTLRNPRKPHATPLMLAVIAGNIDIVEILLKDGARIDAQDEYGFTPLFMSISLHRPDITALLMRYGADANVSNAYHLPALCWALEVGDTADVEPLLAGGANADSLDQDGRPALYLAAALGDMRAVRNLLQYGASPFAAFHGWTVMQMALARKDQPLVDVLNEYRYNPGALLDKQKRRS